MNLSEKLTTRNAHQLDKKRAKQKLAFIADVENITGLHRSTLRRKWDEGLFPKPTMIDGTRLAWRAEIIDQWIDDKFEQGELNNENSKIR